MTETSTRTDLIDAMIAAGEDFFRFGWASATSGNLSARLDDDTLVITATGQRLGELSSDDFVDVDLDAAPTDSGTPSGDAPLHAALYRQFDDIGAVFHIHHLQAALCSDRDDKRGFTHFHELTMLHALGVPADGDEPELNIPVVDAPYDQDQMIEAVIDELSSDPAPAAPCINIKNHGLYVWGDSPQQARRHTEACAYLFEYSWQRPMNPKQRSSISGFST